MLELKFAMYNGASRLPHRPPQ